ncbi:hypothetical protein CALCODRAFT_556618 [Calocera cornea HHB12733]|uniref:OPT superfamily oligopeptide transporter n=1 Tax=Calocera cornea HHB12733 TaxID=1353952 RepID=A0A165EK17_9BASI|nr:hypothetical protein CALCODRAFT_556618 [Calocera cornea HHB12733]
MIFQLLARHAPARPVLEMLGWVFEWTPAFIGVGLLVPLNASFSFAGGAVIAWGIIGPAIVAAGVAFGTAMSPDYPGYINYSKMILDAPVNGPSPKYWFIWPGYMCLLCASIAEIGANYKSLVASFAMMLEPIIHKLRPNKNLDINVNDSLRDPVPLDEQVSSWLWGGATVLSTIMCMIVMKFQFDQNSGITLRAIIIAFFFSLIGAECAGRVSVIPVTTLGNFSQLIFGGISKGSGQPPTVDQLNSGLTGMIALAASEHCADMLGDLKTTHLLGASPRVQLYSQMVGTLVSIFLSAGMYVVFTKAYPCINELTTTTCSFPAPDVGAWRAVSIAVSSPSLPIPKTSGILPIVLGVFVIAQTFVKYRFVSPEKHFWFPNWNALGIAFILGPLSTYPMAMLFGSLVAFFWRKKAPAHFQMFG